MSAGRRRIVPNVALACAAVVVTALGVELALRVRVAFLAGSLRPIVGPVVHDTICEREDAVFHHVLVPGTTFVATGHPEGTEFCVFGEIGAGGYNDEPVPPVREAGEIRVLVLGDSFVEARSVPREENLCRRLESRLSVGARGPVRVINAGVSSYSPLLQYVQYERALRWIEPDVVIVVFFANDVFDDLRYVGRRFESVTTDSAGRPIAVEPGERWFFAYGREGRASEEAEAFRRAVGDVLRDRPAVAEHSYVVSTVSHLVAMRRLRARFPDPPKNERLFILDRDPALAPLQRDGWRVVMRHLRLLREAVARDGAAFVLTSAPIAAQVSGESSYDHFFFDTRPTDADRISLSRFAEESGVPYVDLVPALREAGKRAYYPRDGHWNARGHDAAAAALEPVVREVLRARAVAR